MSHRFRAILFDLDGTLVDTAPDLTRSLNYVLSLEGRAPVDPSTVRSLIGDGARALIERGMALSGPAAPPDLIERRFADFIAYYWDHIADESRPFPGVVEVVTALAEQLRLAVCTNKPERLSARLLRMLELEAAFEVIVGGDSLPVRKPDPGPLFASLDRLGVAPQDALMVGDSHIDVAAARAAGIPVVVVSFGYTVVPAGELGGDRLIDRFEDLPRALAGL